MADAVELDWSRLEGQVLARALGHGLERFVPYRRHRARRLISTVSPSSPV
ncbi:MULTISPECIES: hypothetical protein [Streptomyces]|nr:hypothetical protein [Streptomyces sp. NEAU-HV9]